MKFSKLRCQDFQEIIRTLAMTSNAWTNVEKGVTSNIACAYSDKDKIHSSDWPK